MNMTFTPDLCPECDCLPVSTREVVYGDATLWAEGSGHDREFGYTGTTDIDWNTQLTVRDPSDGRVTLTCDNGHEWQAVMKETP